MIKHLLILLTAVAVGACSITSKEGQALVDQSVNQSSSLAVEADFNCLLIDQKVPSFRTQTIDGVTIDSNYFRHKVTLINFMYIGCAPCIAEAPVLRKLHEDMQVNDFQMLCIAPQTPRQMKALHPVAIPYAIVAECSQEDALGQPSGPECRAISKKFQVGGYPVTLLVDDKGIIRYRHTGFSSERPPNLRDEIKSLFAQAKE